MKLYSVYSPVIYAVNMLRTLKMSVGAKKFAGEYLI